MYQVDIWSDNGNVGWESMHDPYRDDRGKLLSGELTLVQNGISDFQFTLPYGHPFFDRILPMISRVRVRDLLTEKELFTGRILDPVNTMDASGMISRSFVAEDELALFHDTVQPYVPYFKCTADAYLRRIIQNHNGSVLDSKQDKRIYSGTMTDNSAAVYRRITSQSSYDNIMENVIRPLGGQLYIRHIGGERRLYYHQQSAVSGTLGIRLAQNLLSIEEKQRPSQLITRLVPLGAEYDSYDDAVMVLIMADVIAENYSVWWMQQARGSKLKWLGLLLINLSKLSFTGSNTISTTVDAIDFLAQAGAINTPDYWKNNLNTDPTLREMLPDLLMKAARMCDTSRETAKTELDIKRRLNIKSVNNDLDYLDDTRKNSNGQSFLAQYGIIQGTVVWEDVTDAQELKRLGRAWLDNQAFHSSITLSALEVEEAGELFERFEVGKKYTALHAPLGINREYQVTQKVINILESHDSTLTFGDADARITSTR